MDLTKNKQLKFKYSTIILLLHCFIITLLAISCESTYTPKRPAYFRIDFPTERKMANYTCDECPFSFEYPTYGSIQK